MTGGWGWGWAWGMVGSGGGTVFEASFTESSTVELVDYTPDVDSSGNGFTENAGDWEVGQDLGYASCYEDDTIHQASCDVGLADCTIQAKVNYDPNGSDINLGLIVRGDSDLSNYWGIELNPGSSLLEIVKYESGQARSVETSTAITSDFQDATQYTVKAVMSGSVITAHCILGATDDSVAETDSFQATGTRHGMLGWHDTGVDVQEFDDFKIQV